MVWTSLKTGTRPVLLANEMPQIEEQRTLRQVFHLRALKLRWWLMDPDEITLRVEDQPIGIGRHIVHPPIPS